MKEQPQKPSKWIVSPLNSQGKEVADPVYISAMTREGAERAGKIWLKTLGVKRVSWVSAILMEDIFRDTSDNREARER